MKVFCAFDEIYHKCHFPIAVHDIFIVIIALNR